MEEVKVIDNGGRTCFAIYFYDKKGNRCEIHVYANSIEEGLGLFFMENETVTYKDIIDHFEIA